MWILTVQSELYYTKQFVWVEEKNKLLFFTFRVSSVSRKEYNSVRITAHFSWTLVIFTIIYTRVVSTLDIHISFGFAWLCVKIGLKMIGRYFFGNGRRCVAKGLAMHMILCILCQLINDNFGEGIYYYIHFWE